MNFSYSQCKGRKLFVFFFWFRFLCRLLLKRFYGTFSEPYINDNAENCLILTCLFIYGPVCSQLHMMMCLIRITRFLFPTKKYSDRIEILRYAAFFFCIRFSFWKANWRRKKVLRVSLNFLFIWIFVPNERKFVYVSRNVMSSVSAFVFMFIFFLNIRKEFQCL